jgi:hypothetical protein
MRRPKLARTRLGLVALGTVFLLLLAIFPLEQLAGRLILCLFACDFSARSCCTESPGANVAAAGGSWLAPPEENSPLEGCPAFTATFSTSRDFNRPLLAENLEVAALPSELGRLDHRETMIEKSGVGDPNILPRPPPIPSSSGSPA